MTGLPWAEGRPPLLVVTVRLLGGQTASHVLDLSDLPGEDWPHVIRVAAYRLFLSLAPEKLRLVVEFTLDDFAAADIHDPSTWAGHCPQLPGSRFTCHWQGVLA